MTVKQSGALAPRGGESAKIKIKNMSVTNSHDIQRAGKLPQPRRARVLDHNGDIQATR